MIYAPHIDSNVNLIHIILNIPNQFYPEIRVDNEKNYDGQSLSMRLWNKTAVITSVYVQIEAAIMYTYGPFVGIYHQTDPSISRHRIRMRRKVPGKDGLLCGLPLHKYILIWEWKQVASTDWEIKGTIIRGSGNWEPYKSSGSRDKQG